MFYDETKVDISAGKGGDGCFSMRRAKYVPKGGPDGGDGGKGGDVILVGDGNEGDLRTYHFNPIRKAENGEPGRGKNQNGAGGEDCILKVPPGTVVQDAETGRLVVEILEEGKRVTFLHGGSGGRGNTYFKSPTNQAPRQTTPGEPGESGKFKFVLKTIADIGLVGFPNAGKSSLIGMLTHARPRTANYPFTTKDPSVGIVEYPDSFHRLTLADIPGLINGASRNRGLGHRFLRHIERCKILLLVVDMAGIDGRSPESDYRDLLGELEAYDPALLEKPRMVAANKMDEDAAVENLRNFREKIESGIVIHPISCLSEQGVTQLKEGLRKAVHGV